MLCLASEGIISPYRRTNHALVSLARGLSLRTGAQTMPYLSHGKVSIGGRTIASLGITGGIGVVA